MSHSRPILIVGGYGVVGQRIATLIRRRDPERPLWLGGRNPERGVAIARDLGHAEAVKLDLSAANPLEQLPGVPAAIVSATNDPHDHLLLEAVRRGIPLVDITRWTDRLRDAVLKLAIQPPASPIAFASGWMGGIAPLVAACAMQDMARVDRVETDILYGLADQAGPDSVAYMDRFDRRFSVTRDGQRVEVEALGAPRRVAFSGGRHATTYQLDTPEQATLPLTRGVGSALTRIAFDDPASTAALAWLARSGIWQLLSGDRFKPLRRGLLYRPGPGAPHELRIEVSGLGHDGRPRHVLVQVIDPAGQTHLTAVGAVLQLERVLGLGPFPAPEGTLLFPETTPELAACLERLREEGVSVTMTPMPAAA